MQQDDDAVWESLRHNNCNFMNKTKARILCKNGHNGTGRCSRSSCPLANSTYASIFDHKGVFVLHVKSTGKDHIWDIVELWRNYDKSLETIDKYTENYPKPLVDKVKRRLRKMTRMRSLELKMRGMIIKDPSKKKKREVAVLEKSVEIEMLERIKREFQSRKCRNFDKQPRIKYDINGYEFDSDFEDFRTDRALKDAEYGDIDKDYEEAGISDQPMKENPKVFGTDFGNSKWIQRILIEEPKIEYVEGDYELEKIDIEDLMSDKPLKDADYGDIDEDIEEAGTSDLLVKRRPKVFGPNSGKSKNKSWLFIEIHEEDVDETQMSLV